MNKIHLFFILALLLSACSSQKVVSGIKFKLTDFDNENKERWISSTEDAKQYLLLDTSKLMDKNYLKTLDSTYQKHAQYIFLMGGGCFTARVEEMDADIKGDTLNVTWHRPKQPCPPTGKRGPANLLLELDKTIYPNYKNLKVKLRVDE